MHHDQWLAGPCSIYLVWCLLETFQGTTKEKNERMKDEGGAKPPLINAVSGFLWQRLSHIAAHSKDTVDESLSPGATNC